MDNQSMNDKVFDPNEVITKIIGILVNPVAFFRKMQKTGGYFEPLVIVLVSGVLSAVITVVYGALGLGLYSGYGSLASGFAGLVLMPVYFVIGSFIGGAIYYVIVKLMGSKENFEVAYRCVAFSSAIYPALAVLSVIPYVGVLIQTLWPMGLLAIASIHVHGVKERVAWMVFGIIGIIFALTAVSTEYAARHITNDLYNLKYQIDLRKK